MTKICIECKLEFKATVSNKKCCSPKCRKKYKSTQAKLRYSNKTEEIKSYSKQYYEDNKLEVLQNKKQYYESNIKVFQEKNKEYRDSHKKEIALKRKERYKKDLSFKLMCSLRNRLHHAIKNQVALKTKKSIDLLGADSQYIQEYLESKFQEGMTWDNYGKWHVDHIIPCNAFDLTNSEEQKKCFHYSNLQPLWAEDNYKKGNKLNWEEGD